MYDPLVSTAGFQRHKHTQGMASFNHLSTLPAAASSWSRSAPSRQQPNFGGNGTKSLRLSIKASLKKLQITCIDLLHLHFRDTTADLPEIMRSLNQLFTSGNVLDF
ncbi:norsolorinic acid reductase [Colletotrichum nymphaeae SA-01]|uniref:Norsolorinic acid reductase n=1 Tax=Colletotrichum nymphaeae SA-01 TaxID=1460502 RepID=A0A135SBX4_9PEZI|nr:norsolorinic acid reductase [Colletotrichum nymphaeae SA-01]